MIKTYTATTKDGWRIVVKARLDDECKNWHYDFSITADVYSSTGKRECGGCCHDEILEYFPDLKIVVDIHLSDINGVPMYAVENGMYHIKRDLQKWLDYLRLHSLNEEQKLYLQAIAELDDKNMFFDCLKRYGALDLWKQEAIEAIQLLEMEEVLKDARAVGRKLEYTSVSVPNIERIRKDVEIKKAMEVKAIKDKEIANHKERVKKELRSHTIKMAMLDITTNDNRIYYNHNNTLKFDRMDYADKFPTDKIEEVKELSKKLDFVM